MMNNIVYRSTDGMKLNEDREGAIEGLAVVIGSKTNIGGYFDEIIEAGALDNTDLRDVKLLINHDSNMTPLARSRNNSENSSMRLSVDAEGLKVSTVLDIENNDDARKIYSAIRRGDVQGMSFAFVIDEDGQYWEGLDTDMPIRHIRSIKWIQEVSIVNDPAYTATSVSATRAAETLESAKATLESELKEQKAKELRAEIKALIGGIRNAD